MSPRPVVAAAIVDSLKRPTMLLAAQRSYPAELAGLFELPGGKVDRGEDPMEALHREIHEELGVAITLGRPVPSPSGNADLRTERLVPPKSSQRPGFAPWPILQGRAMWVWFAQLHDGDVPHADSSHSALRWVGRGEALDLPWIGTNAPIVESVLTQMH